MVIIEYEGQLAKSWSLSEHQKERNILLFWTMSGYTKVCDKMPIYQQSINLFPKSNLPFFSFWCVCLKFYCMYSTVWFLAQDHGAFARLWPGWRGPSYRCWWEGRVRPPWPWPPPPASPGPPSGTAGTSWWTSAQGTDTVGYCFSPEVVGKNLLWHYFEFGVT